MTARLRLASALCATALLVAAFAITACAPQPPQPSKQIAEQAATMNRLQINMAESASARMTKLATAEKWQTKVTFVTLHDNVLVFWVSAKPTDSEIKRALEEVAAWLSEYQGSLYTVLEIRDYSTAENYGEYPISRPEMNGAAPADGTPANPTLATPATVAPTP